MMPTGVKARQTKKGSHVAYDKRTGQTKAHGSKKAMQAFARIRDEHHRGKKRGTHHTY